MKALVYVMFISLTFVSGCTSLESRCEDEKGIPLSHIPVVAVNAAQQAVVNINLTEAAVEKEGRTVYVLEGTADGKEYEVEVTADGKVLEVEQEGMYDDYDDD